MSGEKLGQEKKLSQHDRSAEIVLLLLYAPTSLREGIHKGGTIIIPLFFPPNVRRRKCVIFARGGNSIRKILLLPL